MGRKTLPTTAAAEHMYIHIRMPTAQVQRLDTACDSLGMTRTATIALAVTRLLNDLSDAANDLSHE